MRRPNSVAGLCNLESSSSRALIEIIAGGDVGRRCLGLGTNLELLLQGLLGFVLNGLEVPDLFEALHIGDAQAVTVPGPTLRCLLCWAMLDQGQEQLQEWLADHVADPLRAPI